MDNGTRDTAGRAGHDPGDGTPAIARLSSRVVYENRHLRLREDEIRFADGTEGVYSHIERPDFALIIAMENDGFHLVEQYRYPVGRRSWEFPQGTFPGMRTGDPEELAREELRQETGLVAATMRHIGRLHCAKALTGQAFDVFVATGLTPGEPELEVEEQDLVHRWVPRSRFEDMIRQGLVTDDSTLAAYALLLLG